MECGTARIEITPPFETALFGYPAKDRTFAPHKDKVLDPLHARAVYIQNGNAPGLLFVVLDLCIILTVDSLAYRTELASELRLPVENIILSCTHTHSAPLARLTRDNGHKEPTGDYITDPRETSIRYGQWLLGRIKRIAALALSRRAPVILSHRETLTGLGYNRRCRTPDGIRHCWNIREFQERIPEPMRNLHHSVLKFEYKGKAGGVIMENVGIHPVVMGKENHQISGDWPCYARRHVEKRLNGYQAVFTMGPGAQVHPWIATQNDPKGLKWIGEAVGAEAILMAAVAEEISIPDEPFRIRYTRIPKTEVEIGLFELGRILMVIVPFELSATLAHRIICDLGRPVIFHCLSNGWDGYWMSPEEFEEGGYEVEVARSKGVSPATAVSLLEKLKGYAR